MEGYDRSLDLLSLKNALSIIGGKTDDWEQDIWFRNLRNLFLIYDFISLTLNTNWWKDPLQKIDIITT